MGTPETESSLQLVQADTEPPKHVLHPVAQVTQVSEES